MKYFSPRATVINTSRDRILRIMRVILPKFQDCPCCEKYLKENKHNSLHLARKYAWIFVHGTNIRSYNPSNLFAHGSKRVK